MMVDQTGQLGPRSDGRKCAVVVLLAALALAGCGGSTKTTTIVRTVTETVSSSAVAPTTSTSASAPTATQSGATTPAAGSGTAPALNGTYAINQSNHQDDINVLQSSGGAHDGIYNADKQWIVLGGSCNAQGCTVDFRRILSDNTLEGLVLFAPNPTGVYTGNIPGTLGTAQCGVPIKERMTVRVGGIQQTGGQQIASRLAGVITAYYQCPGASTTDVVATYTGIRS